MDSDGHKKIVGQDLFKSIELAIAQQQSKRDKCVNNIDNSTCKVKQAIAKQFPESVSGIGLSKKFIVISKLDQKFTAKHKKDRRVSMNLKPKFTDEFDTLQKEVHKKIDNLF